MRASASPTAAQCGGVRPPHPHAVEERHDRGRPAAQPAERFAVAVLHRLRAGDAARVQVLHQRQEKRHVAGRHALLVEREDVMAAPGMDQEVRVLDALGDTLVGLAARRARSSQGIRPGLRRKRRCRRPCAYAHGRCSPARRVAPGPNPGLSAPAAAWIPGSLAIARRRPRKRAYGSRPGMTAEMCESVRPRRCCEAGAAAGRTCRILRRRTRSRR